MSLPTSSRTITVKLPDQMLVDEELVTELEITFVLKNNREYSGDGQTMSVGVYSSTVVPDPGGSGPSFGIIINEETRLQQRCINSLARVYAASFATELYNTQEGTDYPGLQWPLSSRVVENASPELGTFRPRGMGGAYRIFALANYATVDDILEPFWFDPVEEIEIWMTGLVFEDPGSSAEQALLDYGAALELGDDVIYGDFLAVLDALPGVQVADEFFMGLAPLPSGTSNISMGELQQAVFSLPRIDVEQTPETKVEIWISGFVFPDPGSSAEQAMKDFGDTLDPGDDVIYGDFISALEAVPGIGIVDELKIDTVNPPVGESDIPIGINTRAIFSIYRIDIQESDPIEIPVWIETLVDAGSTFRDECEDALIAWASAIYVVGQDVVWSDLYDWLVVNRPAAWQNNASNWNVSKVGFEGLGASPSVAIAFNEIPVFAKARIDIDSAPV